MGAVAMMPFEYHKVTLYEGNLIFEDVTYTTDWMEVTKGTHFHRVVLWLKTGRMEHYNNRGLREGPISIIRVGKCDPEKRF